MKKILLPIVSILLFTLLDNNFASASILTSDLLQYALYYTDCSNSLFQGKYDATDGRYYICDANAGYCGLSSDLFQINYDSLTKTYYICDGSVGYCGLSSDLFQIKDGYICPGTNSTCNQSNSLGVPPALIPIESIISVLEGATSSLTYNMSKTSYNNGTYYICNSSTSVCGFNSDFMQIKYDSNNGTYYVCDGSASICSFTSDFMQIKYDSNNGTYYVCDGSASICSFTSDFMQIKYDSNNETYYVCDGSTSICSFTSDFMQIKKDGSILYTCNSNTPICGASNLLYKTIFERPSYNNNGNNKNDGVTVIVSEESWNMLSNKYNDARSLIEKGNYDEAIKLLNEVLSYEGTIIWGDNYDLARKVLAIAEDGKNSRAQINNGNSNTNNINTNTTSSNRKVINYYENKNDELKDAIQRMYNNGLTRYNNVNDFLPYNEITREQASKFFVEFAVKELGKSRGNIESYDIFSDLKDADPTLKDHIIYANNMGMFKGSNGKFMPFNKLTKAQALAVAIRMVDGYLDESSTKPYDTYRGLGYARYSEYVKTANYSYKLNKRGTFDNFDSLDNETITRGELALLLYEMHLYREVKCFFGESHFNGEDFECDRLGTGRDFLSNY